LIYAPEAPDTETLRVPVIRVFDGDGFLTRISIPNRDIEIETGVRLGFIDAPELEQPGGHEARDFLSDQIHGRWVDLIVLMKMDTGQSVDRHRRIVAVPYLWQDHDQRQEMPAWRNIELEMILNGWAWVLDRYEPPEHYFDALEDAQRNRRGIWARDDNVHPWEFKAQKRRQRRRQATGVPSQRDLFSENEQIPDCPTSGCNGRLIERSGKRGHFYGCSEFPTCRYSRTID
jgi:endonuclease YncB( thermonuclease family)